MVFVILLIVFEQQLGISFVENSPISGADIEIPENPFDIFGWISFFIDLSSMRSEFLFINIILVPMIIALVIAVIEIIRGI